MPRRYRIGWQHLARKLEFEEETGREKTWGEHDKIIALAAIAERLEALVEVLEAKDDNTPHTP